MADEPQAEEPSSDAAPDPSEPPASSIDAHEPKDPVGNVLYRIVWLMVFVAIPIYIVLRLTVL